MASYSVFISCYGTAPYFIHKDTKKNPFGEGESLSFTTTGALRVYPKLAKGCPRWKLVDRIVKLKNPSKVLYMDNAYNEGYCQLMGIMNGSDAIWGNIVIDVPPSMNRDINPDFFGKPMDDD
jgi:hypothetical protein